MTATEPVKGVERKRAATTNERIAAFDPKALALAMQSDAGVVETSRVVLCLMKSEEIEQVIEYLEEEYADEPSFQIEDSGTFYRLDCDTDIVIDCTEIEPLVGHRYNVFDFMVNVTTTIGRAYNDGQTFIITTDLMGIDKALPRE